MVSEFNLMDNLIYQVFGNAVIFAIVMTAFFVYYAIKYNIPKEATIIFIAFFLLWLAVFALPTWLVVIIIFIFVPIFWIGVNKATSG